MKSNSSLTRRGFLGGMVAGSAVLGCSRLGWSMAGDAPGAGEWSRKKGPLATPWTDSVDARMPLPEYPRPQMVRKDWLNLNGVWEYQPGTEADEAAPFGKTLSGKILVPYPVESSLSGVMEHHDRLWYRRMIAIPAAWHGKKILLHFGAIDYESEIFVNGQRALLHKGGYDPFSVDITSLLKPQKENELVVRVFDPTEKGGQPRGKQNTHPRGITYTPTTGIWQTVWIEPVAEQAIESLEIVPDIDKGALILRVITAQTQSKLQAAITVRSGETRVASLTAATNAPITIPIPNAKLWSPDSPHLYTLDVVLKDGTRTVDSVSSYFGMRKMHVGDVNGEKKLLLNNKFVFQFGPLDQGFWPDGIHTPPTDAAMKSDIAQMKAMGFNMVRKHIKVEPARWYYWADTLGLMVWQDMPSSNSYPGRAFVPSPVDKEAFEADLRRMVETHKNTPSIVLWTIFNENQGQFDTGRMVKLVQELDSSRPVNEASGGMITGAGDLNDIHSYPEPAVRPSNGRQAMVCGEFGGIGYLIPEHAWQPDGRGYVEVDRPDDLLYLYAEYIDWVKKLRDQNNLSAAVYTQLTDVMTEVNGLLTYDRKEKVPVALIRRVNSFEFPAPTYKDIVPTAAAADQPWKFVLQQPTGEWTRADYDDAQWTDGKGAFGNGDDLVRTKWASTDIWLRRKFNPGAITENDSHNLVITELHAGAVEMFVNGQQTYSQQGNNRAFDARYEHRPISTSIRMSIVPSGENVLAVHCRIKGDKQFFDAGLSIRVSSVPPIA